MMYPVTCYTTYELGVSLGEQVSACGPVQCNEGRVLADAAEIDMPTLFPSSVLFIHPHACCTSC